VKVVSVLRRLCLACLLALATAAHAGENGHFGINVKVEGDGAFWNPTLKSVKVAKVVAGSSAEKAEVAVATRSSRSKEGKLLGRKPMTCDPK
jgi:hypothetical protein